MRYSVLECSAAIFAAEQHKTQTRKYTSGLPYIVHPAAVADIVRTAKGCTEEMLAAAWLHDVVEDCPVTLGTIQSMFGSVVARYVDDMTEVAKKEDGNRAHRVARNRAHSAGSCPEAKTIKIADVIHNQYNLVELAPKFAPVYLSEKKLLLDVLGEGDADLLAFARGMTGSSQDDQKWCSASPETLALAGLA